MSPLLPLAAERTPGIGIPPWLGYLIVAVVMALGFWRLFVWWKRARDLDQEYLPPPGPVPIRVRVRRPPNGASVDLEHFGRCWTEAFEMLAQHGPWKREDLLRRLGPGNKVQVMAQSPWWSADYLVEHRTPDVLAVADGPLGLVCRTAKGVQLEVPAARLATRSAVKKVGDQGELVTMGQLVGGELVAGVLHVGPGLEVLCHELAHRAEEVLDANHFADNAHATWPARGITAADSAYRAWLAKQA